MYKDCALPHVMNKKISKVKICVLPHFIYSVNCSVMICVTKFVEKMYYFKEVIHLYSKNDETYDKLGTN